MENIMIKWIQKQITKARLEALKAFIEKVDNISDVLKPAEAQICALIPGKKDDEIVAAVNNAIDLVHALVDKINIR
jgi:hypothetical protein